MGQVPAPNQAAGVCRVAQWTTLWGAPRTQDEQGRPTIFHSETVRDRVLSKGEASVTMRAHDITACQ